MIIIHLLVSSGTTLAGQGKSVGMEEVLSTSSDRQADSSHIRDWLLIATVLDRLFFLIYITSTILLTLFILVSR